MKKQSKKKVISHLKGDVKSFKNEIKEDKTLISKLKKPEKEVKGEKKRKK